MSGDEGREGGGSGRDLVTGVVLLVELQEERVHISYSVTEKDVTATEGEAKDEPKLDDSTLKEEIGE